MEKIKKYMHKKIINFVSFVVSLALVLSAFGCQSYEIHSADHLEYNRKSLISAGKIVMDGVKKENDIIKVDDLQFYHSNGYFSIDISGKNVQFTDKQFKDIIQK